MLAKLANKMRFAALAQTGIWLLLACSSALGQSPADDKDAAVVRDFEARVNDYLQLKKDAGAPASKPTNSSEKITSTQQEARSRVREARGTARRGEIFTPAIAAYFRRRLADSLNGPEGAKVRASLRHAEPVKGFPIHANARYPSKVALQSTPPSLLLSLPTLPKEMEYRIVDRTLILRDARANLIVDYVPNAIPPL